MKGIIFSIEEFALYDGPGIRTAIFFKGCPLRCAWCHNPEGLLRRPQIVRNPNGCLHCGACERVCPSPDACRLCGQCILACPRSLIRISGTQWEAADLADKILAHRDILQDSGGGVTMTGGEVLLQGEFLLELLGYLRGLHRAIETSGFGPPDIFMQVLSHCELVFFDLKHMDNEKHVQYTRQTNDLILQNAAVLMQSGVPFIIRIPLVAGVNDDDENIRATAAFLQGAKSLRYVELLPCSAMAGAKYAMVGMEYDPRYTAPAPGRIEEIRQIFEGSHIPAQIR